MPVTTTEVPSSASRNSGRITFNTNDTNLKNGVNALESALSDHQTYGHPSLYYTKSEIDAQMSNHISGADHDSRYALLSSVMDFVSKVSDQVIDGWKKFLQKITVSNTNPSIELMDASGSEPEIGQFAGGGAAANDRWVALQQWISGDYKNILISNKSGKIDFPRGKPSYNGKDLATEEYVQARVKSGTITGATVKILTPIPDDPPTQSDYQIFLSGARVIGFDVVGLLPGGVMQRYGRFNVDISTTTIFQFWLQNSTADSCDLMIIRPEEVAGEPFASRMLYSFNLSGVLPAGVAFYIVPVLTV